MRNYGAILENLREADAGSLSEMSVRFTLLGVGFLYLALWTGNYFILLLYLANLLAFLPYARALSSPHIHATRATYRKFLLYSSFLSLLYALSMWVMLFSNDLFLRFGAFIGITGQAIFALGRHRALRDVSIVDVIMTSASIFLFTSAVSYRRLDTEQTGAAFLFASILAGYFALAMHENYNRHKKWERGEVERQRAQRLSTVGQLTAGIAHDFNNTLTAVMGNLDLFHAAPTPAEKIEAVFAAQTAAQRAADMTQQLLSYARKAPLNLLYYDPAPTLKRIASEARMVAIKHEHQDLEVIIDDALHVHPPIIMDAGQLQNAVTNLLRNASEAANAGGDLALTFGLEHVRKPTLVSTGSTLTPNTYLSVSVSDNGPGIDPSLLERVTEPFYSTKRVSGGSGLGLAMVHGFADQSGGGLDIRSSAGKGTVVTLFLPA